MGHARLTVAALQSTPKNDQRAEEGVEPAIRMIVMAKAPAMSRSVGFTQDMRELPRCDHDLAEASASPGPATRFAQALRVDIDQI